MAIDRAFLSRRITAGLAVAGALLFFACCGGWLHLVTQKAWTGEPTVAEANSRLLRFRCAVPQSATDIKMTVYGGREPWVYVRFSADCSAIEQWLTTIKPEWPSVPPNNALYGSGDTAWFNGGGGVNPKIHWQWAYKDMGMEIVVDEACETVFFSRSP
jgi:hypothetical protein